MSLLPVLLRAQSVPQLVNYQGRVAVGGVNFSGTGQFKFALVNADGSQTYWSNDGSSAAGSAPASAVSLSVAGGLYSVLLGDASLANMQAIPRPPSPTRTCACACGSTTAPMASNSSPPTSASPPSATR